jgi:hypothetical protein
LPTKCYLKTGSLSTAFLTSLALASFLSEAKQTFTNFLTAHHNLESSRATPSRLGDFNFKSNKCHKDCFTKLKCSSAHKEDSLNLSSRFSHKSQDPHKEVGESSQKLRMSVFCGWHQHPPKEGGGGEILYLSPPKLAVRN